MAGDWITATIEERGPAAIKPYVWTFFERYVRTAAALAEPLGLDPRSRVELQKLMADAGRSRFDLARYWMEEEQAEQSDG